MAGLGAGTINLYISRVFTAIEALRAEVLMWPNAEVNNKLLTINKQNVRPGVPPVINLKLSGSVNHQTMQSFCAIVVADPLPSIV